MPFEYQLELHPARLLFLSFCCVRRCQVSSACVSSLVAGEIPYSLSEKDAVRSSPDRWQVHKDDSLVDLSCREGVWMSVQTSCNVIWITRRVRTICITGHVVDASQGQKNTASSKSWYLRIPVLLMLLLRTPNGEHQNRIHAQLMSQFPC